MYAAARTYLATGVAVVGASALAVCPLSPVHTTGADLTVPAVTAPAALSTAAVHLTSLANPIQLWAQVLSQAVDNAGALGRDWLSDPAPVLRQLLTNQIGYLESLADAGRGVVNGLGQYFDPANPFGATAEIQRAMQQFSEGDIFGGVSTLTGALITGTIIVGVGLPLFESGVLDIPAKMAQNAADVIASAFSLTTALPLLAGVLGPIINPINALGSTAQDVVDSLGAGDVIGALTAVVNIPAVLTGALLNGFEAADGTLLPGLLSVDSFSGGLVQGLLLTIPRAIADALGANTSARTAAVDEVSSVSTDAPATVTLDVPDSAPAGVSEPEPTGVAPATPVSGEDTDDAPAHDEQDVAEDAETAVPEQDSTEVDKVTDEAPAENDAADEDTTDDDTTEDDVADDDAADDDAADDESTESESDADTDPSSDGGESSGDSDSSASESSSDSDTAAA
ncbi:hypothetical protein [Mycolicibacterium tokaiense]|uniref:hypothetical protein n=1 Tax=Mycolicibacterium tokaiense TaxID=39695 RepID=UPI0021F2DCD3|nr:hypothetical protein [Mycolicibacterium tokaiense]